MKKHPLIIIQKIIDTYGDDFKFEFSHYVYTPQTVAENRTTFSISANGITTEQLIRLCNDTPKDHDLALHSTIMFNNGEIRHIPMVDLAAKSVGIIRKVVDVLPDELKNTMYWFNSGRSYHGYSPVLVSYDEWIKLMGRLLLVNQPQLPPVVDPRWIGHRLLGGYSALRWTCNTKSYIQIPELIDNDYLISYSGKD